MLHDKFIIENIKDTGICIILGRCKYHRDLAGNESKIRGGGLWSYDKEKEILKLFGESYDFGSCDTKEIEFCVNNDKIFTSHAETRLRLKNNFKTVEFSPTPSSTIVIKNNHYE